MTLYRLHLSTHKAGFGKPSVQAVNAMAVGHVCEETGALITPKPADVREALPHYYRKAFDRGGQFWFDKHEDGACYCTLRDCRGRWLNTIYATPYVYPAPQVAA